jgi:hypothetical protein
MGAPTKGAGVATPSDQPGWRPDPEQPGTLRWWNGLGWSDARRAADDAMDRVRDAAHDAARGSTISASDVARTALDRRTVRGAPAAAAGAAVAAANPFAAGAIALGILGLAVGLYGVLSLVGLVVSLAGLARSRRLAAEGSRRTGLGRSLAGLVLSGIGLLRWIPVVVNLLPALQATLNG